MAPAGPLAAAANQVYGSALAYENDLYRRERLSGPALAAAGAQEIERLLAELGFSDYDEFMLTALPGEVAARGPLLTTAFARPHATGGLAQILHAATRLNDELEHIVDRLGAYRALSSALGPATDAVLHHAHGLQHSVEAARSASLGVAEQSPVLLNVARVMGHPMGSAVEALHQLAPELGALRHEVAELGFRIALGRLHIEMVGAFAAEVVDGVAPVSSLAEVPRLCDALDGGVLAMAHAVEEVNQSLGTVAGQIRSAGRLMQEFRGFLGQWRILVLRQRQSQALADHMAPIDMQLDSTADQLAYLESLAGQCASAVAPFDRGAIEPHLRQVRAVVGYARV
jgi:aerotaxis receptor